MPNLSIETKFCTTYCADLCFEPQWQKNKSKNSKNITKQRKNMVYIVYGFLYTYCRYSLNFVVNFVQNGSKTYGN